MQAPQFQYSSYEPTGNHHCVIKIIEIKDPSNFIARFGQIKHFKNFKNLQDKLDTWCQSNRARTSPKPCALDQHVLVDARHHGDINGCWCRAKIAAIGDGQLTLYLIDHGLFEECGLGQVIFELPEIYFSVEPQVKTCRLLNAKPIVSFGKCIWQAEFAKCSTKNARENFVNFEKKGINDLEQIINLFHYLFLPYVYKVLF